MRCQLNFFFFLSNSAAGQGLKSSLRKKHNSVYKRPFRYFFVHLNMRWVLYKQYTFKSSYSVTWLIGELSFFARAPAVPPPPVPAASAAVSRLGTPRHEPSSLPAGPSVRPVPLGALSSLRAHSRVTRHPCLAAKLNLPELQPW